MTPVRKIFLVASALLFLAGTGGYAQDEAHFRKILHELSSARYQGRGYARDGVIKAGEYIAEEYRKAGADEVSMQPFSIDINTFPGANDNASGTAALITLAEYYAKDRPQYDMYFISLSGEEANLRGSNISWNTLRCLSAVSATSSIWI